MLEKLLSRQTRMFSKNFKLSALNIEGKPLRKCSTDPMTGYFRDGYCNTGIF